MLLTITLPVFTPIVLMPIVLRDAVDPKRSMPTALPEATPSRFEPISKPSSRLSLELTEIPAPPKPEKAAFLTVDLVDPVPSVSPLAPRPTPILSPRMPTMPPALILSSNVSSWPSNVIGLATVGSEASSVISPASARLVEPSSNTTLIGWLAAALAFT